MHSILILRQAEEQKSRFIYLPEPKHDRRFRSQTLLLVDDDQIFRSRLAIALRKRNHEVWTAGDAERAIQLAKLESPELAIVDLRMPGQSGLSLVRALLDIEPNTRILVLTAYGSIATALEAVRLGAKGFLQKPAV